MIATRHILAAIAITMLALARPADARDEYANVHKLGLVSALGDAVGTAAIYDHNHVPIVSMLSGGGPPDAARPFETGWGIDSFVDREIARALGQRFVVSVVDPASFTGLGEVGSRSLPDELGRRVRAMPANGIDAYVVVYPIKVHVSLGGFDEAGLEAIHFPSDFGGPGSVGITANFQLSVVDARNGKRIDYATARDLQFCRPQILAPEPARMTAAQKAMLKRVAFQIVHDEIPQLLHSAGLISYEHERSLKKIPLSDSDAPKPEGFDALGCNDEFPP